jgi:hypothetical protein
MKILLVWADFFHCDGRTYERTDLTKLIVAFRNIANAPEKRNRMYEAFVSQLVSLNVFRKWYKKRRTWKKEEQLLEQTKEQSGVVRISSKPKKKKKQF